MPWKLNNLTKIAALALVAGLSVGCASTGELEKVRQQATAAQSTANEARQTAETALATANEAKSLAADAQARSRRVEESVNRMFKRSMYK